MYDEGKKLVWRPRSRWKGNIKSNFEEVRSMGMDWIQMA